MMLVFRARQPLNRAARFLVNLFAKPGERSLHYLMKCSKWTPLLCHGNPHQTLFRKEAEGPERKSSSISTQRRPSLKHRIARQGRDFIRTAVVQQTCKRIPCCRTQQMGFGHASRFRPEPKQPIAKTAKRDCCVASSLPEQHRKSLCIFHPVSYACRTLFVRTMCTALLEGCRSASLGRIPDTARSSSIRMDT